MQHDLPGGRHEEADPDDTTGAGTTADEQARQMRFLEEEIALLRRKLTDSPRQNRVLEQRLAEASERVAQLTERNSKLVETLREARGQLLALREEVDRLAQPPSGDGVFVSLVEGGPGGVVTPRGRERGSPLPPGAGGGRQGGPARPGEPGAAAAWGGGLRVP